MEPILTLIQKAFQYHQGGDLDKALPLYEQILKQDPYQPQVHHNLGLIYFKKSEKQKALLCFHNAIHADAKYLPAYISLGDLYSHLNDFSKAEQTFKNALAQDKDYIHAINNLGVLLMKQERLEESLVLFEQMLKLGQFPFHAHFNIGMIYKKQKKFNEALPWLEKAVEIKPEDTEANEAVAQVAIELCLLEKFKKHFYIMSNKKTDIAHRLKQLCFLPPLYSDTNTIHTLRKNITQTLEELSLQKFALTNPLQEIGNTPFYLAYQGYNDREIMTLWASLYKKVLPEFFENKIPRTNNTTKKRIGFVSSLLYNHSVGLAFENLIKKWPKDAFEIVLILAGDKQDDFSTTLYPHVHKIIKVPLQLDIARKAITDQELDILVYTDIGMDPFTYFLSFTRMAAVQCVLAGHPTTTGVPTIDYYLSSGEQEIDGATEHYSETLVLPKSIPDFPKPKLPESFKTRTELGLPEQDILFICPMTLFKLHPEFDFYIGEILRETPNSKLILFKMPEHLEEPLKKRFLQNIPDVADKIFFLPRVNQTLLLNLIAQCDAILDPLHFGAGTTSYLGLATGTPFVTQPTPYLKGRSIFTLYKKMGLQEHTTSNKQEYIQLAKKLATDKGFNQNLRELILKNNNTIFDNTNYALHLSQFLLNLN